MDNNNTNPVAYEWHNLKTGHCYVDYVRRPEIESDGEYTQIPLFYKKDEVKKEMTLGELNRHLKQTQTDVYSKKVHDDLSVNERKATLYCFVMMHKRDCYECFRTGKELKYNEGIAPELIKLLRKEIYYSNKTWDGDIYNALRNAYKKAQGECKC